MIYEPKPPGNWFGNKSPSLLRCFKDLRNLLLAVPHPRLRPAIGFDPVFPSQGAVSPGPPCRTIRYSPPPNLWLPWRGGDVSFFELRQRPGWAQLFFFNKN